MNDVKKEYEQRYYEKHGRTSTGRLSSWELLVYWGTVLYVLIMPFLYSRLTTENFLTPKEFFSRIAIVLIGGLVTFSLFSRKKVIFAQTSLDMPLFLFFAFCALSVIWNFNGVSAIRDLRGVFSIMLLFPIIVNSFKERWQVETLLWVIVFTGVATATIGFLETYNFYFKFDSNGIHYVKEEVLKKIIDPNGYYLPLFPQLASPEYAMGSVVSTFGNRNYLGTFVMFVAFVPLAFFFYYKKLFMKVLSLGIFGWLAYGLYMTRCRASLIGLGVGLLFMFVTILINDKGFKLLKQNKLFFGLVGVIVLCGLIISAMTISSESMLDKLKLTFTLARNISNTYERMWVWFGNNQAFSENIATILIGQGFGSFKHFFPLKQGAIFGEDNMETFTAVTFRQAHNDWIQIFSELGIVGMILFLFIIKRMYGAIQVTLRRNIYSDEELLMNGDHVMLIALGSAVVSQLFAALPDFPFHRIETAVFVVVFMGLIMVIAETDYFRKPVSKTEINIDGGVKTTLILAVILGVLLNFYHEYRCWKADTLVREAEIFMTHYQRDKGAMERAKYNLTKAIGLDPLPGDPYAKLAAWFEMMENDAQTALNFADKAWNNINFNARSTYHSIIFRRLHIYYHVMNDMIKAYAEAMKGLKLTAGDARSIYYLYAGKIAADVLRYQLPVPEEAKKEYKASAEKYLQKAMQYEPYRLQAQASLAIYYTQFQSWAKGYEIGKQASKACNNGDPTLLDCLAICAMNLNKREEALVWMKLALKFAPANPIFNRDIAVIYKSLGDYENARKHFELCASSGSCPEPVRALALKELNLLNK